MKDMTFSFDSIISFLCFDFVLIWISAMNWKQQQIEGNVHFNNESQK